MNSTKLSKVLRNSPKALLACFPNSNAEFRVCTDTIFSDMAGAIAAVHSLINFLIGASALVAVILIIYSGYNFILSAGDPDKVSKSTKTLTNAIIGMIIIFIANLIIKFVLETVL